LQALLHGIGRSSPVPEPSATAARATACPCSGRRAQLRRAAGEGRPLTCRGAHQLRHDWLAFLRAQRAGSRPTSPAWRSGKTGSRLSDSPSTTASRALAGERRQGVKSCADWGAFGLALAKRCRASRALVIINSVHPAGRIRGTEKPDLWREHRADYWGELGGNDQPPRTEVSQGVQRHAGDDDAGVWSTDRARPIRQAQARDHCAVRALRRPARCGGASGSRHAGPMTALVAGACAIHTFRPLRRRLRRRGACTTPSCRAPGRRVVHWPFGLEVRIWSKGGRLTTAQIERARAGDRAVGDHRRARSATPPGSRASRPQAPRLPPAGRSRPGSSRCMILAPPSTDLAAARPTAATCSRTRASRLWDNYGRREPTAGHQLLELGDGARRLGSS